MEAARAPPEAGGVTPLPCASPAALLRLRGHGGDSGRRPCNARSGEPLGGRWPGVSTRRRPCGAGAPSGE